MKKNVILLSLLTVLACAYLSIFRVFDRVAETTFNAIPCFLFEGIFPLVFGFLLLLIRRGRVNVVFLILVIAVNLIAAYICFWREFLGLPIYNVILAGGAVSLLIQRKKQPADPSSEP